jgi:hypothetical protein
MEEEERPTDINGYQELVEKKIQAGIAQGQFDTKALKYAGVDLLAANRGQGDLEVQRVFGASCLISVAVLLIPFIL